MSIRFRVRVVNHGITLEEAREAPDDQTVGELIAELSRIGFIPFSEGNVVVAFVRDSVVGSDRTLRDLFENVPEADRLIVFSLVAPEQRDLLETLSAAKEEEDLEASEAGDEEDLDLDEQLRSPPPPQAPPPPQPPPPAPRMPLPPAPGSVAGAPAPPRPRSLPAPSRPAADAVEWDVEGVSASPALRRREAREEGLDLMQADVAARRATVRHYDRMNPQKVYPFMVSLTAEKVKKILQKGVAQAESKPFEVKLEEHLTIEPILPGCTCYPARAELKITAADTAVHFWVVPQVLGQVKGAKVTISQDGRTLTEVELDIRVRRTTLAIIVGVVTLLYPFAAAIANQFGIDFKNLGQLGEYISVVGGYVRTISPLAIFGGLILVTGFLYWWSRPRERDQFWDLETEPKR